jgi:tripartite-type tricarboxylate transporter receptor subunit TctC
MRFPRRRLLHLAATMAILSIGLGTVIAASGNRAWSQTTRAIKIVVATTPGGVIDFLARLMAEHIGRAQRLAVVVENRPGASEAIGTEAVARAAPDGNTLLIAGIPFVITPQLRKVDYHPLSSFEPICHLVSSPTLIVVNSASPYRSLADLIDAARAKPGGLTLASVGPGSQFHLGFEKLRRAAKIEMTFVPYPGMAPAVNALLGGHVTAMFGTYSNVAEHMNLGKLRALAVATPTRIEAVPDMPTLAEAGYKDHEVDAWYGAFAPQKTPQGAVAQLADWFIAAMQMPEVKAKLLVPGLYPVGTCGAEFGTYLRKQYDGYGRVIRDANIKAE